MDKAQNPKRFDLEERTFDFASNCKEFIKKLPKNFINRDYSDQLLRASSSVAANYIEANESLSRKDYFHRVRICRKEAKESRMWLRLVEIGNDLVKERDKLMVETIELMRIFGSILEKARF